MQEIARTDAYKLHVDSDKNRIYFTVIRIDLSRYPAFREDWELAARQVKPGFTVLIDISRLSLISSEWIETSVNVHRKLVKAGLAGSAEILSLKAAKALGLDRITRIPRQVCYAREEVFTNTRMAEAWLDGLTSDLNQGKE